ncbi:MAG TPA: ABC transporter ATP-binding protein [Candidatus Dormibacteraeota bacterium]|nr:ABC transporter ATP-binding protein [Candidatus Dormibacteraeota bacterium]
MTDKRVTPPERRAGDDVILRLEAVNVRYAPIPALVDVEMEVHRGEIVCLLGGNASGKSTTMKTIIGAVRVRAGDIWYEGQNICSWSTSKRVRAGIAIVPEARRIFPRLTVLENLMLGAFTRTDKDGVAEDLERVMELFPRLGERQRQRGGTLSGGEQQMLAIARALMSRPRFLCMDEPSMGLAPVLVEQQFDEIQHIRERGITVFVVEQNAAMALAVADRGYVLQSGRVVLSGTAQQLLDNPQMKRAYLGV